MKKYQIILLGECGDETIIAEGNNRQKVKKEARGYLKYTDPSLTRNEIKSLINGGLLIDNTNKGA